MAAQKSLTFKSLISLLFLKIFPLFFENIKSKPSNYSSDKTPNTWTTKTKSPHNHPAKRQTHKWSWIHDQKCNDPDLTLRHSQDVGEVPSQRCSPLRHAEPVPLRGVVKLSKFFFNSIVEPPTNIFRLQKKKSNSLSSLLKKRKIKARHLLIYILCI